MKRGRAKLDPEERASLVLEECGIKSPPVPVAEIAEGRGVAVRHMPLKDELSGMIFVKNDMPVIVVNSLHHANRQRFTIAHELGHHVLHMSDIGSEVHVDTKYFVMARDENSSKGFDRKEIEANRFAAELLVPKRFLRRELKGRVIDVEDAPLIAELARAFEVSPQMMSIRIGQLAIGTT
jgi:Zn-dependent peptidase ImmA (M78 family)